MVSSDATPNCDVESLTEIHREFPVGTRVRAEVVDRADHTRQLRLRMLDKLGSG